MFACPGVTGDARAQCDGNKVLFGLGIDLDTSIGVWFAGMLGLFVVYVLFSFVRSVALFTPS